MAKASATGRAVETRFAYVRPATFSSISSSVAASSAAVTWIAGVNGVPALLGEGALTPGTPASVTLSGAAPSSLSVLIAGLGRVDVPFLHGVLVPDTDILVWLQTDATGGAVVAADWPDVLAGGLDVYFQQWTLDPAASFGASASNALQATTP